VAGCLDPETTILMSDGTSKLLKDVTISDKLIGYDLKIKI